MTLTFHKYIKLLTLGFGLPLQMCLIVNEPAASVFPDWFRDERCNPPTRAIPLLNGGSWPGCWSPSLQTEGIISLLSAPASSSRHRLLTMVSIFGHPSSPAPIFIILIPLLVLFPCQAVLSRPPPLLSLRQLNPLSSSSSSSNA